MTSDAGGHGCARCTHARVLFSSQTQYGTRYVLELGQPRSAMQLCCYGLPAAGWWLGAGRVLRRLQGLGASRTDLAGAVSLVARLLESEARRNDWPARGVYADLDAELTDSVAGVAVPRWGLPAGLGCAGRQLRFFSYGGNPVSSRVAPPREVATAALAELRAVRETAGVRRAPPRSAGDHPPDPPDPSDQGNVVAPVSPVSHSHGPCWSEEYRCVARSDGSARRILSRQATMPRSLSRQVMRCGYLLCNGWPVTVRQTVSEGDRLTVLLPAGVSNVTPERGQLAVLYEDRDLLAVNKPHGRLIHPARSEGHGTLANLVAGYLADAGEPATPRPVGRLDRGVSGLSIWARTKYAHAVLATQRASGQLVREYLAITGPGNTRGLAGVTDERIMSPFFDPGRYPVPRSARTLWRVLARWPGGNLVLATPESGRTHQIRQHLAGIGLPLQGDTLYGGDAYGPVRRTALHAWRARFRQPVDGRPLCVRAPLPSDMRRLVGRLAALLGPRRSRTKAGVRARPREWRRLPQRTATRSDLTGGLRR